ncbi:Serine-rich coiled-coil domain-containing protein [Pristimantis euphronides]
MGDVGTKRSALVSRLPIFRRTLSRRQDSLPSSPSSNNTSGLHSSSPSSTNSSSGSTGKRRSIFRTPSLSFHYKKDNDQKYECNQDRNNSETSQNALKNLDLEEQSKVKLKGSSSIPGSCRKKLTRSLTENFEGKKEHSTHKNLFTNCLGKSEADDSGFIEDQTRRSSKHSSRRLLPRSFSSHYRLSKRGSQCATPSPSQASEGKEEVHIHTETTSLLAKPVIHSTIEDYVEHSLQSPLVSTDHTTAPQTPSDFTFMDDSASEADSLPNSTNQHSSKQQFCSPVSTSQNVASSTPITTQEENVKDVEDSSRRDGLSHTKAKVEEVVARAESNPSLVCSKPLLPICELSSSTAYNVKNDIGGQHIDKSLFHNGEHSYSTQTFPKRSGPAVYHQRHATSIMPNHQSLQETNRIPSFETPSAMIQHGHTRVNYASSFSPHRDGRYLERRLRSSSEGTAGGSRMAFKPKEGNPDEGSHFRKQRTISTSSKMNSMNYINQVVKCNITPPQTTINLKNWSTNSLYQRTRMMCWNVSAGCVLVYVGGVEQSYRSSAERGLYRKRDPRLAAQIEWTGINLFLHLPKDSDPDNTKCPRVCQVPNSPSVEWPFAQEDCTGLESLPYRLMMQDCTSVKTLLLKMKRILQESSEMSPASSTTSLPISPIAERSLSFKDIMKDDCSMLKLQLKERDELIHQLQEELKAARTLQPLNIVKQDKYTQTEFLNHEMTNNVQRNTASTEGSVYKAIRPAHCFQHYQFKANIWTQDALH